MTDMLWETMETPDGPFTVLADDEGTVLSAGWSSDPETVIARVRPADRPARAHAGVTGVAAVVSAYYDGDLAAIDEVRVRHFGTELQGRGWAALRRIPAGTPLTYTVRGTGCRGNLCAECAGALRAVSPRAAVGRHSGRVRVGCGGEAGIA